MPRRTFFLSLFALFLYVSAPSGIARADAPPTARNITPTSQHDISPHYNHHNTQDWKKRSIYFLMVDRFATTSPTGCNLERNFCGGNLRGLIDKLPYIRDLLGHDAIWITPVVRQLQGDFFGSEGYHGYWASELYDIDSRFGSKSDLKELTAKAHELGMYVMMDVAPNHLAPGLTQTSLFNKPEHFHYPREDADPTMSNWWEVSRDQARLERIWFFGLADLNTENDYVIRTLNDWVSYMVREYNLDGLRADTVRFIRQSFWPGFVNAAGVYTIGEVLPELGENRPWFGLDYIASYQRNSMPGVLNFPNCFVARAVFAYGESMRKIPEFWPIAYRTFPDVHATGQFIDNHDIPRFHEVNGDAAQLQNALVYAFLSPGMPIVYYGTEQWMKTNRAKLWDFGYRETHITYMLRMLNKMRRDTQLWTARDIWFPSVGDKHLVIERGENVIGVLTNMGEYRGDIQVHDVKFPRRGTWKDIFSTEVHKVDNDHERRSTVLPRGHPRVFVRISEQV